MPNAWLPHTGHGPCLSILGEVMGVINFDKKVVCSKDMTGLMSGIKVSLVEVLG